jgi:hypothetical protein
LFGKEIPQELLLRSLDQTIREMRDEELRELKREAKAANIYFKTEKYTPLDSESVLTDHNETFAVIQSLGRTVWSAYRVTAIDGVDKPWQRSNTKKAAQIALFAKKCRRENRNEAGWRNEIESKIFQRFDIEVAW